MVICDRRAVLSVCSIFFVVLPEIFSLSRSARSYLIECAPCSGLCCDNVNSVHPTRVYYGTDTRAQALFVGMALAGIIHLRGHPHTERARAIAVAIGYVGVAGFVIAVFTISEQSSWMFNNGGFLGIAVIAAVLIVAISQPSKGPLHVFCQWGPLRWLGRISYGVYLFHWPIYLVVITPRRLETTGGLIFGLVLTVAAARDVGLLAGNGYSVHSVTALDLFPETHHVEVVSVLTKS